MKARQVRERQYRRLVTASLGVSAAVHGVVLGLSAFNVDVPAQAEEERAIRQESEPTFEIPALKLVTLESPASPTVDPVPTSGQLAERPAPDPTPAAPSPESRLESQVALSMRFDFTARRSVSDFALQPVRFAGTLDGGDQDDENDRGADPHAGGRSWWEGLGIALGIGGGGHCPVREPATVRR